MATQSSNLAWKILWTEGPVDYSLWGHRGVRHDWATKRTHMGYVSIFEIDNTSPSLMEELWDPTSMVVGSSLYSYIYLAKTGHSIVLISSMV